MTPIFTGCGFAEVASWRSGIDAILGVAPLLFVLAAALAEGVAKVRRDPIARALATRAAGMGAILGMLVAATSAVTVLESGDPVGRMPLILVATAGLLVVAAAFQLSGNDDTTLSRSAARLLLGPVILLTILVWTDGWDSHAAAPGTAAADSAAAHEKTFSEMALPILERRCTACHGEEQKKGGLDLRTLRTVLTGGKSGPATDARDPAASLLLARLRLPLDDRGHMPPRTKPQPAEEEIAALASWLKHAPATMPALPSGPASIGGVVAVLAPPSRSLLQELLAQQIHVQSVAQGSPFITIDFSAVAPSIDDDRFRKLIAPVAACVTELGLARTAITDESLETIAAMRELRRLDLADTGLTTAGLRRLKDHPGLRTLIITSTKLDPMAVQALLFLPKLEEVFVWRSGLETADVTRLRESLPKVRVDAGDLGDAEVLELEPEFKLTSDRALPGASTKVADATTPAPLNTICPVSGTSVDPRYAILFEGRAIGFCCPNCPAKFWADPAAFRSKLP